MYDNLAYFNLKKKPTQVTEETDFNCILRA